MAKRAPVPESTPAPEQPQAPQVEATTAVQEPVATEAAPSTTPATEPQAPSNPLVDLLAQRFGETYEGMTDDDMIAAIMANAEQAAQAQDYQRRLAELEAVARQQPQPQSQPAPTPAPTNSGVPEWDQRWMFAKTDDDGNIIDPVIRQKVEDWRIYQQQTLPNVLREWGSLDQRINSIVEKALGTVESKITGNIATQQAESQFTDFMTQTPGMFHEDANGNLLVVNNNYKYTPQGYKLAQYRQNLIQGGLSVAEATKLAIEAAQLSAQPKPMPAFRPAQRTPQAPAPRRAPTSHVPNASTPEIDPTGKTWGELIEASRARLGG
jgi:hypothetical protein